ncbi:formate dehydrogenase subunit alpha [Pelomyxa schiedti]|nr:formate dehydrogenase subunit alpha [Pelomyxa schiedti]
MQTPQQQPPPRPDTTIVIDGTTVTIPPGTEDSVAAVASRAGISLPSLTRRPPHQVGATAASQQRHRQATGGAPPWCNTAAVWAEFTLPGSPAGVARDAAAERAADMPKGTIVSFCSAAARDAQKRMLQTILDNHIGDCYPPCQMACPCKVPAGDFLRLVREGRYQEALLCVVERNPFSLVCGTVCPRFCEDACRRNVIDEPVNINDVKRFLYLYNRDNGRLRPTIQPPTGKTVGIVGGGPAGLACAHFLTRFGHKAVVFEGHPLPGGMLRYGIPEYRLSKVDLDDEINYLCTDFGVDIRCNMRLGTNITLEELKRDFDAVYIAIGSQLPTMLRFPGSDLPGVLGGVDFLEKVACGVPPPIGKRVVVIGGGNVSADVARSCVRMGASSVVLSCILKRENMPAHPTEIQECLEEGIKLDCLAQPMKIMQQKGLDGSDHLEIQYRKRPKTADIFDFAISIPGTEYSYVVDTVIIAIGQRLDTGLCNKLGIALNQRGNCIRVDPKTYAIEIGKTNPLQKCIGVFAGGDAVLSPVTVVQSVNSARIAASAINELLTTGVVNNQTAEEEFDSLKYYHSRGTLPELLHSQNSVLSGPKRVPYFSTTPLLARNHTRVDIHSPTEAPLTFTPITTPFDLKTAQNEASRCLQCGCGNPRTCVLRQVANSVGVESKTVIPVKPQALEVANEFIHRDLDKCIRCGECFNVCSGVRNVNAIEDMCSMRWNAVDTSTRNGKWSAHACESCGTCVDSCPTNALYPALKELSPDAVIASTCSYCGCGCGIQIHKRNGFPIAIKGDTSSDASHGQLCVKGRFGLIDYNTSKERLTTPLIRKNGVLVPCSWDEAMTLVAAKFSEIKARDGSEVIQGFSSAKVTNEENFLFQKVFRGVFGTNNVDHCARLCHASTVAGLATAFGSGAMTNTIDELEFADCILVTGSNTTETHPIIGLRIKAAAKRGAKLIVADPRSINLTAFACLHMAHRPGTDVFLFNAMMNVIISERLMAKKFIDECTENFTTFETEVGKYTPEAAELITGVLASDIRKAARLYATSSKSSIIFSMGITQHSTGVDNVLTLANLAMLCGQIGRPSTGVNPLRGQNNVQGACDMGALPNVFSGYQRVTDPAVKAKFERAWGVTLSSKVGNTITQAINLAYEGKIKAIYCMGENPMLSDPNLHHVEQALKRLEFFVVQDIFLTETAKLAHVVLPAASLFEKTGTFTNTERRCVRVQRAMAPPPGVRQDWEILVDFANRMRFHLCYANAYEILDEINALTPSYEGITNKRVNVKGLQWPCPNANHPGTPYLHKDGKFTRGKGLFSAVPFREPAETPSPEFPLLMTTGRLLYQYHTGTMSRKCPGLNRLAPTTHVEISTHDAEALGVRDRDQVTITTARGSITAVALVPSRVRVGVVFLPFHFAEAPCNILTNDALDPVAAIPEFKACACRITKAI